MVKYLYLEVQGELINTEIVSLNLKIPNLKYLLYRHHRTVLNIVYFPSSRSEFFCHELCINSQGLLMSACPAEINVAG